MSDPRFLYNARMRKPDGEEYNFVFRADDMELAKDHIQRVVHPDTAIDERYKNHKIIRVERF